MNYRFIQNLFILLLTGVAPYLCATGLTWPANQLFPTFSTPAFPISCIDMDGLPGDQQACFCSLEGIVNRTQPRLACVSTASEGQFTWINIHNLWYNNITGLNAILRFETNLTGLVVYDTNEMDTLNLATTISGVKNELICDGALLNTLTNSPYNLTVKDDLRGMFTTKYQVYGYLYTNYWSQCTHRLMAGLETNNFWFLRDYLVATKCAVVWLDPAQSADATTLAPFISSMTPAAGVYIGWWPNEGGDLNWIAQYGIPVVASDFFDNATVYGGVTSNITIAIPPIPPVPPLQNKIYVSLTLSDGDNVQYMQHAMYINWQSSSRGTVPIGWTVQPLSADFDPGMLNYFTSTATTNDCFVAGPSGAGYAHIENWNAANIAAYTKVSSGYLQRTGIRAITVWDNVSASTANAYATNCPTLVGISDEDDGYYTTSDESLPVFGLPANGNYTSTVSNLLAAITNTTASWNGTSPMFVPVQGVAWNVTPADCQAFASSLNSKYILVRPDQLYLLYQEASGLGKGGAVPYIALQPASQLVVIGTNITFRTLASGTGPLSYQWQMNGTNIPGATGTNFTKSNVQLGDTGNYQAVVTNNYGAVTSSVAVLTFGNQPVSFNGNGLGWALNDNSGYAVYAPLSATNNGLMLTDGAGGESRSYFYQTPQYIGAFEAAFTYQAGGDKAADGATFCLQNDPRGASALGGGGGELAYGAGGQITPGIALELNLYTGNSQKIGYTVLTNGLTGGGGANGNYQAPGSVNIASGDPINIAVDYANGQMALTFTDAVANTSFSTNLAIGNLPGIIGTNDAYVGFTGADGGSTSVQIINNFSFVSIPSATIQTSGTNALIVWPSVPGYALQQNCDLSTNNWISVTNLYQSTNQQNQVLLPIGVSNAFYRLVLSSSP